MGSATQLLYGTITVMAASYNHCLQTPVFSRQGRVALSGAFKYRCGYSRRSRFQVLACSPVADKDLACEKRVETLLDSVKWDDKGLAVAIAQNVDTGAILMQGFVNRDALAQTISSRKATFYSRSRSKLCTKGETSLNFINVHDVFLDCHRDSIIYLGKPDGPTCHTGAETCYFSSFSDVLEHPEIREEADGLCRTLEENEEKSRAASEMADVLYHSMVLLALKDVKMEDVLQVLRHRFSKSGIEEKKARKSQD